MKNLRYLREKAQLSVKDVADKMQVSPQAVGKWERGESFPRAEQMPKLADLFGCTIDELYGREADTAV